MFTFEIETDNAAFEGENLGAEIAKHLRDLAKRCEGMNREDFAAMQEDRAHFGIRDSNGNKIGSAKISGIELTPLED